MDPPPGPSEAPPLPGSGGIWSPGGCGTLYLPAQEPVSTVQSWALSVLTPGVPPEVSAEKRQTREI